ncbi:uncharacterized protein LOC113214352 [Frankliniella occidentalis]|uniref:Uncharacterized protein LOC113214352 n=1 Tax=Frankliniella occidentalis TaxID=133901 RepID=A0A6J1T853_FRAOC|nr:uncharacterized protein LOC113214352 [Frankliniella occidentalis]
MEFVPKEQLYGNVVHNALQMQKQPLVAGVWPNHDNNQQIGVLQNPRNQQLALHRQLAQNQQMYHCQPVNQQQPNGRPMAYHSLLQQSAFAHNDIPSKYCRSYGEVLALS